MKVSVCIIKCSCKLPAYLCISLMCNAGTVRKSHPGVGAWPGKFDYPLKTRNKSRRAALWACDHIEAKSMVTTVCPSFLPLASPSCPLWLHPRTKPALGAVEYPCWHCHAASHTRVVCAPSTSSAFSHLTEPLRNVLLLCRQTGCVLPPFLLVTLSCLFSKHDSWMKLMKVWKKWESPWKTEVTQT
jgi:hypothetical protein